MTDGILSTVENWTGIKTHGCPWRGLMNDPFVHRVVHAYEFHGPESLVGISAEPVMSHRLAEGLAYYHRKLRAIEWKRMELDREEAKRKRGMS